MNAKIELGNHTRDKNIWQLQKIVKQRVFIPFQWA